MLALIACLTRSLTCRSGRFWAAPNVAEPHIRKGDQPNVVTRLLRSLDGKDCLRANGLNGDDDHAGIAGLPGIDGPGGLPKTGDILSELTHKECLTNSPFTTAGP